MLARRSNNWQLWNPWTSMNSLHKELFDVFSTLNDSYSQCNSKSCRLMLDQDEKNVKFTAFMPGYKSDDIDVQLVSDFLTITAKRKNEELPEDEKYIHSERSFGEFEETVSLPCKVVTKAAQANYKNGVLEVTVPKMEEEKPKQIKVS